MTSLEKIDHPVKAAIIKELYFQKKSTNTEISSRLGKSFPLVTKLLNELEADSWIQDAGLAASSGGRKPKLFTLSELPFYMISISMNRLVTKIAILNLKNELFDTVQIIDLPLKNNFAAIDKLSKVLLEYLDSIAIDKTQILGVGVAMPGFVNVDKGENYSYSFETAGLSIKEYLFDKLQIPVYVDNDSSAIALAELRFGKAKNNDVAMVLNIGWGIGLGMIVNSQLYRGYNGYAGELSHIPVGDFDLLCDCGKRGCLETEATLMVVSKKAMDGIQEGVITDISLHEDLFQMSKAVMDAANSGHEQAIDLLSEMGYKIGKAVAILIHIENPQSIILSGRGAQVGAILIPAIQSALAKYCIPRLAANVTITTSNLGKNADLIGAACLVMDHFATEV